MFTTAAVSVWVAAMAVIARVIARCLMVFMPCPSSCFCPLGREPLPLTYTNGKAKSDKKKRKPLFHVFVEVVVSTFVGTRREACAYALSLHSVAYLKFTTFQQTTALQRCKLSCRKMAFAIKRRWYCPKVWGWCQNFFAENKRRPDGRCCEKQIVS